MTISSLRFLKPVSPMRSLMPEGCAHAYDCVYKQHRLVACLIVFALLSTALYACAPAQAARQGAAAPDASRIVDSALAKASAKTAGVSAAVTSIAPVWQGLVQRLAHDGISGPAVNELFSHLAASPTQSPMGRKIQELYTRKFFPRPKTATPPAKYYKGVVTAQNAQLCRDFIKEHAASFRLAQERYGVPPSIAGALLFVETRLGKVLADVPENAFYTLASMAVSVKPADIDQWLPKLKGYEKHLPWIEETMQKRSNWAYNETKALVLHMLRDNVSPANLPSSIYGAVGLCQFMPSNIPVYGADGDGDGRVDLFNVPDAIASLANYLARHGWKPGISLEKQHKVLMSYNHSVVYANTILALASLIDNDRQGIGQLSSLPGKLS